MRKIYGKCTQGWGQPTKFGKDNECILNYECSGDSCMFMVEDGVCPYLEKVDKE